MFGIIQASQIEFFDINQTYFLLDKNITYHINASYKLIDLKNLRKYNRFYNRKRVIKKFDYTKNGVFYFKKFNLKFFKSFRVNDYLYFNRVEFILNNKIVFAKECKVPLNTLKFITCYKTRFYTFDKKFFGSKIYFTLKLR